MAYTPVEIDLRLAVIGPYLCSYCFEYHPYCSYVAIRVFHLESSVNVTLKGLNPEWNGLISILVFHIIHNFSLFDIRTIF